MRKFSLYFSICLVLLVSATVIYAESKDTFVKATNKTVRTLDPASCYESSCGMRIRNLYETLVEFDGESTENFLPLLAIKVPSLANGGITEGGTLYTFHIRKGVKFHNSATLTATDVEYSLERNMLVDQSGGPSWMFLEAVLGAGNTGTRENGKILPGVVKKIMDAIVVKGNKVSIKLIAPYPPLLGILQGSWGSIVNKKWAIRNKAWDGSLESASKQQINGGINNPQINTEPLQYIANGTGAYELKSWEKSKQFVFGAFSQYWGGKPFIQTAIVKYVPEWTTLKLMLMNGDVDTIAVNRTYVPEIKGMKDITIYQIPQLEVSFALFNQKIQTNSNPDIGSGKLDGEGIPFDFFADKSIRLAFLHAIDYKVLKEDIGNNLINNPGSPNIKGLPYFKEVPMYPFDLEKAKEYLKNAYSGKVWEKGFKMSIPSQIGNTIFETAVLMMAENMNSLSPKIQINVRNVEQKAYTVEYKKSLYPIFFSNWKANYPDPHNFLHTFMHSKGVYGQYSHYNNPEVDKLIEDGIFTTDPVKREKIYYRSQAMWKTDAVGAGLDQPILVKVYRKEVNGFVPNAMFDDAYELLRTLKKR